MKLSVKKAGSRKIIKLSGEINTEDIKTARDVLVDFKDFSEIVVDLSGVDYLGTRFINLMVQIRNQYPKECQAIKFINPNDCISETLNYLRLNELYTVYTRDSLERIK
jgi:anti-anti-sigma factor